MGASAPNQLRLSAARTVPCPAILVGITVIFVICAQLEASAQSMENAIRDTMSDTWVATDALGRTLPGYEECGPPREDKYVGIFYFLWMMPGGSAVHDISRILAANPQDPDWGPPHAFHWWGEPYFGYYTSDDEYVIRKHAQMLSDAGVDAVFFDVTNGYTYDEHFLTLCRVYRQLRELDRPTPQIAFLTHSATVRVVTKLYREFYSKSLYPELWFRWQGKPLILASEEGLSDEIRGFFTFRESWAWSNPNGWFGDGRDKWPWLDHHPQTPGWHEGPDEPEHISVCAAQHPVSNIGRSFHDGRQPPPDELQTDRGPCFAEQWRRALQVDPQFIFVTGWNEWIAQRFIKTENRGVGALGGRKLQPGDTYFVDQYSQEYSRDIEPMRGGHGDNYYYQMVANIRRFKGMRRRPEPSRPKTIDMRGDFTQWQDVKPEFRDDIGDTVHRNEEGYGDAGPYTNESGRNDIELAKIARDDEMLYFYVRARQPLSPHTDPQWMLLLIDADGDGSKGWCGFDFIVNRRIDDATTSTIERNAGGWSWEAVGGAEYRADGPHMHVAVPRRLVELGPDKGPLKLDFKWADNPPDPPDPMDFIDKGDCAPNGRFKYRFEER